ncbi:MMPL family transporter [Cellulomonas sp. P5_E12]
MTTHDGPLTRIATWSATHRWTAIGLWLAAVALTAAFSVLTPTHAATALELGVGESGVAARIAADAGHVDPLVENALLTARSGTLDATDADAAAAELSAGLGALDEVSAVQGPITSDDGSAILVRATMSGDPDTADARVPALQALVAEVQAAHPGLRVEEVGPASIDAQFQEWLGQSLGGATVLSVPVTLVILLVVFGAIVMAGIPLVLALFSVASGLGLWALASQLIPDPGMVPDVLVLMGLAVGVDYSLFYLRRFREERRSGQGEVDAIRVAARTAGHSVLVSGVAVMVAVGGLYVAGNPVFSAIATGAILVVLVSLVSSLTVLPALLAVVGRWVDRPRVPVLWRLGGAARQPRVVPAVLRPVLAHPAVATTASVGLLLALAAPLLGISLHNSGVADFPRELSTMQGYDRLVAAFPQSTPAGVVVATVPVGEEGELVTQVEALENAVTDRPEVFAAGTDAPWFSTDGRTVVLPVAFATTDSGPGAVDTLRDSLVPVTLGSIDGADVGVGGDTASDVDFTSNLERATPIVLLVVLALTFAVMLVAFRSLAVAGLTVLLNVLSMGATFGILTAAFQGPWADPTSRLVVAYIPMLVFVILSGLSIDYHVFVVSRVRENAMSGMSTRDAILDGVSRTAGTVTSAALVMIGVFSIFAVQSYVDLRQLGVGLAVGILLDATLVRVVVLPATMMLARRHLWWPGDRSTAPAVEPDRVLASV